MGSKEVLFEKFTARIIVSKKSFFGFNDIMVKFWVTYNLKIIQIKTNNIDQITIPFKQGDILDIDYLKNWASKNKFTIIFTTKNSTLKRQLFGELEDVIEVNNIQKKKYKIHNNQSYTFF